jgi:hypothetical protein
VWHEGIFFGCNYSGRRRRMRRRERRKSRKRGRRRAFLKSGFLSLYRQ